MGAQISAKRMSAAAVTDGAGTKGCRESEVFASTQTADGYQNMSEGTGYNWLAGRKED